ncbi:hypothetical protein GCM10023189_36820 [Nibrella saemangeumensis]|uniref:Uncharacterized protein n=1 Tax=Nibrella saemangeumensis TaxID=1084526 RepID=A0ABP8N7W3_9BACT
MRKADFDQSRVVAYSLLAHINNHDAGIKNLGDIFVLLVKRVIARMSAEGKNRGGSAAEIKVLVDNAYSLMWFFLVL